MASWLVALTIGLPWMGALAVLLARDGRPRAQHALATGFSGAAGVTALGLLVYASSEPVLRLAVGGGFDDWFFVPDGLGVLLAVIATVVGCMTVLYSADYMRGSAQLGRYYGTVLVFIGAMAGLTLTGSLLLLFFFWELVALCSYALISFDSDDPKAVSGGITALVITQAGGVGLLCSALFARAYLGSDRIDLVLAQAGQLPLVVHSLIGFGILASAAAKSAQAPFHSWLPAAMEAPTPISALIHAATMVNAGVYLLVRFYPAFAAVPGWAPAVMAVGVVSMVLGALSALAEFDLKRVLAYSTISQIGLMVYAAGAGAVLASQFHLLSHAVFKALLFLAAGLAIKASGTRDMRRMAGLGHLPFVRNVFLAGALALVGLPVLNGFWSKELVIEVGLSRGPWWVSATLLAGVALTAVYTFRMVWMLWTGPAYATDDRRRTSLPFSLLPSPFRLSPAGAALGLLALGTLTSWLLVGPLSRLLSATLPSYTVPCGTTNEICGQIVSSPSASLALAALAAGLAAWWWRRRLAWLTDRLDWLMRAARAGFGFDTINTGVGRLIQRAGMLLSGMQTGQLNWNLVGLVAGLTAVLLVLNLLK
jgi:NADH-quinone oxidoreductase subunit L